MYCPNELFEANITAKVPEMNEVFATEVLTNFYQHDPCNHIVYVFNAIRMVHTIVVFVSIIIFIIWAIISLRAQRSILPIATYKLQVS